MAEIGSHRRGWAQWRAAAAAAVFMALGMRAQAAPAVTELVPIPLQSGVNRIPKLAPDGRDGMIVLGWRENGNAHGYDLALVLLSSGVSSPWNVAKIEAPDTDAGAKWQDGVTNSPHTGEDMVRAFRFARGRVDGHPATLLLIATRDDAATIPEASKVTFQIYRLEHKPDVGTTPDHFALVQQDRSSEAFCNAEMALSKHFGLALRTSYVGPRTATGCR